MSSTCHASLICFRLHRRYSCIVPSLRAVCVRVRPDLHTPPSPSPTIFTHPSPATLVLTAACYSRHDILGAADRPSSKRAASFAWYSVCVLPPPPSHFTLSVLECALNGAASTLRREVWLPRSHPTPAPPCYDEALPVVYLESRIRLEPHPHAIHHLQRAKPPARTCKLSTCSSHALFAVVGQPLRRV